MAARMKRRRARRPRCEFWVTRDRRITQIYNDLVEGNMHSIYYSEAAARSAAYPTEKVWRIEIRATELPA